MSNCKQTTKEVGGVHKALTTALAMHGATLIQGDSRKRMAEMDENSVDCLVTDPPYGMSEKEPDAAAMLQSWLSGDDYQASSKGLLNLEWDSFVPSPALWREALRVLKPGGYLLAFASSRTIDLTTLALRLAGFEIRDGISWHYSQGMPLHKNVKLKASHEPIVIARKPVEKGLTLEQNQEKYGVGHLDTDALRIGDVKNKPGVPAGRRAVNTILSHAQGCVSQGAAAVSCSAHYSGTKTTGFGAFGGGPTTPDATPSRRLGEETLEQWACVDGCPFSALNQQGKDEKHLPARYFTTLPPEELDIESVVRGELPAFAYFAKPGAREREAGLSEADFVAVRRNSLVIDRKTRREGRKSLNVHTTVKPIALMRWLIKLVCPQGGLVLDPFNGSGSTGCAAVLEGRRYIGIDLDSTEGYLDIAAARICHWAEQALLAGQQASPKKPSAIPPSNSHRVFACQVGVRRPSGRRWSDAPGFLHHGHYDHPGDAAPVTSSRGVISQRHALFAD
jgi:site-specific DNA-methyltransferase (adenine-specific)